MDSGWYLDGSTGRWYFLLTAHDGGFGRVLKGWYNESSRRWEYNNRNERPLGSLYTNEMIPDGYRVDENGVWIQETPYE